jgi:hypothetical protein
MTVADEEDPVVAVAAEIKRSQSSLELLSNTAAWKNVVESQQQQQGIGGIGTGGGSVEVVNDLRQSQSNHPCTPEPLARVSPSDQSCFRMNTQHSFCSGTTGGGGGGGAGDFRKEMSLSFDDAASLVRSPSAYNAASATAGTSTSTTAFARSHHYHHGGTTPPHVPNPGLPLMNDSSVSLVSSVSSPRGSTTHSNNSNSSLHPNLTYPTSGTTANNSNINDTTLSWRQHLNPTLQGAFTPPRSNSRTKKKNHQSVATSASDSSFLPVSTSNTSSNTTTTTASTTHRLPVSRQTSIDEGESWSVGLSLESTSSYSQVNHNTSTHPYHHHGASHGDDSSAAVVAALQAENHTLKVQLQQKDHRIAELQKERDALLARVNDLRQLPTGKISQIPIK